jgi:ArsR family transcriptional regulator
VSRPPYQAKAEFFKTLGHPVRVGVLELLSTGSQVAEFLAVARRILTEVLSGQVELLAGLRAAAPAARRSPPSPDLPR